MYILQITPDLSTGSALKFSQHTEMQTSIYFSGVAPSYAAPPQQAELPPAEMRPVQASLSGTLSENQEASIKTAPDRRSLNPLSSLSQVI